MPAFALVACALIVLWSTLFLAYPQTELGPIILTNYHLTARPWRPLNIGREQYLDAIEGLCRFTRQHQNAAGAIIDPFLHREHQYATPYFASAVATLVKAGRARDLLPNG